MVSKSKIIFILISCALVISSCGTSEDGGIQLSAEEIAGEGLFVRNCASCHATSADTIIVGPSLAGIASNAGEKVPGQDARFYIETSILAPDAYINEGFDDLMPKTFGKTLTGEELDALVAYLLTLR